ncbi:ROK family protein [Georgenia subflava]|uniref:ROK family protein n=1 Tax=Georgenia subflava TaxID=1622177 RepID=A0A6N7ENG2_9MICO|nr:ROK family protein [Georgenia subflava]
MPRGPAGGARQADLREHNLAVLAQTLFASDRPLSRADLAARTGMTRSTTSRLVEDLVAARIVTEGVAEPGRRGRPALPLAPARATVVGLGLEANVDYVAGRVLDLAGEVVAEEIRTGDLRGSDPRDVLGELGELGAALTRPAGEVRPTLAGTVLALPGLIDGENGRLMLAPNLGWSDVVPADVLGSETVAALGGSVVLANEAKLAALAAATAAPGRHGEQRTFVYVSAQVGVGAAVVLDGHVMTGPRGWAGEIGHVCVEPDGPRCGCGARGCLEQYAGKRAILANAGLDADSRPADLLAAEHTAGPSGERARQALDRAAWALGVVLAGTVNTLDVDRIVLGGELAPLADRLRPVLLAELTARVLAAPWSDLRVRGAGDDVALATTGGALLALRTVLENPARWVPERTAP